ncbi:ATP-binding protein [Rhizobium grahamii]|uniref:ATP-binding protein n=1 Tax=Rhizobium grahamii TaxID=1120045 RepID=A0A5Q0C389_9HYPH|nr:MULTISPECIES: ATP-binding protein [Rhizobium]QFY59715.1 ATP-binding protein [Rhizobium grahamii]QRM51172.1 ATP-binding protein [Rhizobium sp. BG6]
MDIDRLKRISEHASVFLVGPNGAGKSRTLKALCQHYAKGSGASIAISNTPFARLPDRIAGADYAHLRVNQSTTYQMFSRLLWDALRDASFSLISMREVLEYTGYEPILRVQITPQFRSRSSSSPYRRISNEAFRIARGVERLYGTHDINFSDVHTFLARLEDIARAPILQREINNVLRSEQRPPIKITFGLIKEGGELAVPLEDASSGELTLITSAMFILSRRDKLARVFVDEPENSLHPHWQVKFFEFITNLLRREDIKFFVATHSAVLANGALSGDVAVRLIKCEGHTYREIDVERGGADESIERILWEAFETVTPVNNYLSESLSDLAWRVRDGTLSKEAARQRLEAFARQSFSNKQLDFIKACDKLIMSFD